MKINGSTEIAAPRDAVWAFLTDANAVGTCVPGLESMEILAEARQFKATAVIGFGTTSVRFVTDVEWLELIAPHSASMKAHGDAAGSAADVLATMRLSDNDKGGTTLDWEADVSVVGQIASLASRLMPSVSKLLTNMFFNCAQQQIQKASAQS